VPGPRSISQIERQRTGLLKEKLGFGDSRRFHFIGSNLQKGLSRMHKEERRLLKINSTEDVGFPSSRLGEKDRLHSYFSLEEELSRRLLKKEKDVRTSARGWSRLEGMPMGSLGKASSEGGKEGEQYRSSSSSLLALCRSEERGEGCAEGRKGRF